MSADAIRDVIVDNRLHLSPAPLSGEHQCTVVSNVEFLRDAGTRIDGAKIEGDAATGYRTGFYRSGAIITDDYRIPRRKVVRGPKDETSRRKINYKDDRRKDRSAHQLLSCPIARTDPP